MTATLTPEEVERLTARKKPAAQRKVLLEKFGINIPKGCGIVVPVQAYSTAITVDSKRTQPTWSK